MLKVLQALQVREAQLALAAVAQSLVPQPWPRTEAPGELERAIIEELAEKLSVDPTEPEGQTAILEEVTREIFRLTIDSKSGDLAKARLGEKGLLATTQYKAQLSDNFDAKAETFRVGGRSALAAVSTPRAYEHLQPGKVVGAHSFPAVSLFISDQKGRGNDRHVILATAGRKASVLRIDAAWRLYFSDVEIASLERPLDFLDRFLDRFGLEFQIARRRPSKLVVYDAVAVPTQRVEDAIQLITPGDRSMYQRFQFRMSPLGVAQIALAYIVDVTAYHNSLRDHDVGNYADH